MTIDVLIMCTRNRPTQVMSRLDEFCLFSVLPQLILIVDSSDNDETEEVVYNSRLHRIAQVAHLKSNPGLPHQRNTGIQWAQSQVAELEYVHFLDDDIIPRVDYFERVRNLFKKYPNAVAIGGFDPNIAPEIHTGLLRRLCGLGSRTTGVVLKSGISIPPHPRQGEICVEWLVGGMQSVRAHVFDHVMFNSRLRMYGEDVDFYLRASTIGQIVCSADLPVKHLNDPSNRDSPRQVSLFHNGIRWQFASQYSPRVRRTRVVQAAIALAIGEITKSLLTFSRASLLSGIGNIEFIIRLISRREVVQLVDRKD